ncbi:MAG: hypothetical protein ACFCBW_01765 [Candidatus Competibacterales bacterium]
MSVDDKNIDVTIPLSYLHRVNGPTADLAPPKVITGEEFTLILALIYLPAMAVTALGLLLILGLTRRWPWGYALLGALLAGLLVPVLGLVATLVPFLDLFTAPYAVGLAVCLLALLWPRRSRPKSGPK